MKDLNGKNKGLPTILIIFSGFMFAGFILTFLLPETKGEFYAINFKDTQGLLLLNNLKVKH